MKKNRGFTLVEILAVIVILAIISSIAIFSMNNLKELFSKKAFTQSVKNLLTSASEYYSTEISNDFPEYGLSVTTFETENKAEYTSGLIKLISDKLEATHVSNGKYCANGPIDNLVVTNGTCGQYSLYYENGTVVYFNPVTGKKCTNYSEANSTTEINNVCMKWYAFNNSEDILKVSLILDHNIVNDIQFSEVSSLLESNTNGWDSSVVVEVISANDIAKITGNTSWTQSSYYLDNNTNEPLRSCAPNRTTGCSYGWLYDRTSTTCKTYGCLNNSNVLTNGYWTSTVNTSDETMAWYINDSSKLASTSVISSDIGLRPIISIYKTEIK